MKRIGFIVAVLILFPLAVAASDGREECPDCTYPDCTYPDCTYPDCTYPDCTYPDCPSEQVDIAGVPGDVYEALVHMRILSKKANLSDREKEQLRKYRATAKGVIVVEVSSKGCYPCRKLLEALQSPYGNNPSVVSQWQKKGVRFYQLDWQADGYSEKAQSLSEMLKIESVPALVFFSNGREVMRLKGYDSLKQEQTMQDIMKYTNQYL